MLEFSCLFLILLLGAPRAAGAQEPDADRPAADPLARSLELSLVNADLSQAVEKLNATEWVKARCEGTPPDRRITLVLDATPLRDVMDALAALFGVRWTLRSGAVVFSPLKEGSPRAAAEGAAPADAGKAQAPLPGGLPTPGGMVAATPLGGTSDMTQEGVRFLRELGIGLGTEPPPGDPSEQQRMVTGLAGLFHPAARERMAHAGPGAYRLGVRVSDMSPALRSMVLAWQKDLHSRQVAIHLWKAAQPFDERKYLDAVMYLSFAQDADGLPRGAPSLALRGADWSKTWALAPSR